jgi:hypothetical protein
MTGIHQDTGNESEIALMAYEVIARIGESKYKAFVFPFDEALQIQVPAKSNIGIAGATVARETSKKSYAPLIENDFVIWLGLIGGKESINDEMQYVGKVYDKPLRVVKDSKGIMTRSFYGPNRESDLLDIIDTEKLANIPEILRPEKDCISIADLLKDSHRDEFRYAYLQIFCYIDLNKHIEEPSDDFNLSEYVAHEISEHPIIKHKRGKK